VFALCREAIFDMLYALRILVRYVMYVAVNSITKFFEVRISVKIPKSIGSTLLKLYFYVCP